MRNRWLFAVLFCLFFSATGFVHAQPGPATGSVTVIPAFPSEFTVLDKIPPGSLGTTWQFGEMGSPFFIASRSETLSPLDGSTALMQFSYGHLGTTRLFRNYPLGQDYSPGSKVALFLMLVFQEPDNLWTEVEAEVTVTFFSGQVEVGKLTAAYSSFSPHCDLVLPSTHA